MILDTGYRRKQKWNQYQLGLFLRIGSLGFAITTPQD